MSKFNTISIFVALSVLTIIGCQPEDDFPEIGPDPLSVKTALLEGTWQASKVTQYDKEAVDNGFPENVQRRDLTDLFPFDEYQITFSTGTDGKPTTFVVDAGSAPDFLTLTSGTWTLDDYVFATQINLTNVANVNSSRFRVKLLQGSKITLQVVRNDLNDNTEYSYYEYEFTKINAQ